MLYYLKLLSLPTPVGQLLPTTASHSEIRQLNSVLVWMLQNHLLMPVHKYVGLNITDDGEHSPLPDPRDPRVMEERGEVVILMEETERPDDKYPQVEAVVEEEMAMGIVGEKVVQTCLAALWKIRPFVALLKFMVQK